MTTKVSYPVHWLAQCVNCGKAWTARNAVAVGARHATATGHEVRCEVYIHTIFNGVAAETASKGGDA